MHEDTCVATAGEVDELQQRIAALEAENERLREACKPLYHTEWPYRVFNIVVDKDFALAEQFAGVMHDIHAALEPLP